MGFIYDHSQIILLFSFAFVATTAEVATNQFKLSDLPVLKRWEVPNERFAKHVGRRYKDLDNLDTKRSTYWERKPEFTATELDWDENPAKIQLDYNYKHFLEDDEPFAPRKTKTIKELSRKDTINKVRELKHKKKTYITKRVRRSDGSFGFGEFEYRIKRDALTDILHKAQMTALKKLDNIDLKLKKISSPKKDSIPALHKESNHAASEKQKVSNIIPAQTKRSILPSPSVALSKRQDTAKTTKKAGVLGDEPGVQIKRSRINDSTKQEHEDSVSIKPKTLIEHPVKEQNNIDLVPSNVARAVAMAMEQLKRDKMWGKVFVHVRPSGQLKVMVQETKRMEE